MTVKRSSTTDEEQQINLKDAIDRSLKRTRALFSSDKTLEIDDIESSIRIRVAVKTNDEYRDCKVLPSAVSDQQATQAGPIRPNQKPSSSNNFSSRSIGNGAKETLMIQNGSVNEQQNSLQAISTKDSTHAAHQQPTLLSKSLIRRREARSIKPDFHPQWKLHRVISGHLGWVRSVAVEPGNQWFVTGAGDRIIKVWDLASGNLKISLTGHISTVRGLAVSDRHPYLFSCGEDKMVKCWDLEQNKVIRHYHGHLSGVYSLSLHPTLDVLVTAGRDASARVWDMRTKAQVHVLSGHTSTIADVKCQESDPQVITGSMDSTIRLWDLAAGRTMAQLTHHHKSVRSLTIHPTEYSFGSGSSGGNNIKKWKCPEGSFVHNFSGHDAIINTVAVNEEGVFYSGADNGSMTFWDYKTGLPFQTMNDVPQPGSLDSESGIFSSCFDVTGTRLITGCADKTIKIYREVS
ncbi:WD40-repeat-containing domain protein [Phakopsora pachyrhizi]|uniref:Pre-mRNA-splicing factor PRP46 n=2 Tax=Phakopsora pachyrhizi TaxID=170000 RepID=A0AAV0B0B7_PHAPC|nr:WD40-repeat-containing domain protein [Phakopsora pachyrhizi]CAH7676189.1 WD40-repeat-containing domain protein [Phakopsora pachyrhizi]